jgi:60 kDa SS-A/Ro ribonucleoprotein
VKDIDNPERLRKSRVHPLSILVAQRVYARGKGIRGSLTWNPVPQIVDVLDEAFYASFGNVKPTNKNILLALDVSGSMTWESIAGMTITPREASAAMALVTANVEPNYAVVAFSDQNAVFKGGGRYGGSAITELAISPKQRLTDVLSIINGMPFAGTDCSLPMLYAIDKQLKVDTFAVYTDSETWAGKIHPSQALGQYHMKGNTDAKLVVVGMAANNFSIADPNSPHMLDVVGFDTATPNLISEFSLGNI